MIPAQSSASFAFRRRGALAGALAVLVLAMTPAPGGECPELSHGGKCPVKAAGGECPVLAHSRECPERNSTGKCPLKGITAPCRPAIGAEGAPLRTVWTSPLGDSVATRLLMAPPEADVPPDPRPANWKRPSHLYVLTKDNRLGCLDLYSGELQWWFRMPSAMLGEPTFSPTGVYMICGQRFIGLERFSGQILFDLTLRFAPSGGPGVLFDSRRDEERARRAEDRTRPDETRDAFLVAGQDDLLRRLEIFAAEWPGEATRPFRTAATDLKMPEQRLVELWALRLPEPGLVIGSVLVSRGQTALLALSAGKRNAGYLYAWNMEEMFAGRPKQLPTTRSQRPLEVRPVLADDAVLLPSLDGTLYANLTSGNTSLWRYAAGAPLYHPAQYAEDPLVNPPLVLQKVGRDGKLAVLAYENGRERWSVKKGRIAAARIADPEAEPARRTQLVIVNDDNTISSFRMADGVERWRTTLPNAVDFCPNTRERFVYALIDGGTAVRALDQAP